MNVWRALARPVLALALAFAVGACGGGQEADAGRPELPRALATDLATRADAIAASLRAGDSCRAAEQARELRRRVVAAIDARRVPRPLDAELLRGVTRLSDQIECRPPPPPTAGDEQDQPEAEQEQQQEQHQQEEEGQQQEGAGDCDIFEARKKELEEQKKALEKELEDKEELERLKEQIEEQKKALEEERKACEKK